jgi:hypothetical protein
VQVVARIQGHPDRAHLHQPLIDSLSPLPVELLLHVSDPPSPWAGYRECLSDLPECSHLLVIQDDASPCKNFVPALQQSLTRTTFRWAYFSPVSPAHVYARAQGGKEKVRYVDLFVRDFCPVVALLWPVEKAREFMDWASTAKLPGQRSPRSDDAVVGRWMLLTKQRIRVTVPSLVQHPDMEPSLIGRRAAWGRDTGRVALMLADDALDYSWE